LTEGARDDPPAEGGPGALEDAARALLGRLGIPAPPRADPAAGGPTPAGRWLVGLALLLAFGVHLVPIAGFDVYTHLAIGDWILDEVAVPTTGLFSATRGDAAWVDNEWGFQALLAGVHRAGGMSGVVLLSAALPLMALVVLARFLRARRWPAPAVALTVGLVAVGLGAHSGRPQLVTTALLALTLAGTLELASGRRLAPVLWLPPLLALWANLHAGFVVGLVAVGVPAAVEAARRLARRAPQAPLGPLALTSGLCLGAAFCNAYGWRQVVYPLEYALRPGLTAFNLEWAPTSLRHNPVLALALAGGAATFAHAFAQQRARGAGPGAPGARLHEAALFGAFAFLSLRAQRHVGISTLALVFALAPAGGALLATAPSPSRRGAILGRGGVVACLLLGFLGTRGLPTASPLREDLGLALPRQATDWYLEHRPAGALFNQYAWGGYLMYRLRPEAAVFVDGRNDLYGELFMAEYLATLAAEPGTIERLDRWGIGAVLLAEGPKNAPLLALLSRRGWRLAHRSHDRGVPVVIWVRG